MNFRNCCNTSIITENQFREMIGQVNFEQLLFEEKRCLNDEIGRINEYDLSDEIDEKKIQMGIFLLTEKAKNGYPLFMISKPWVSRDYAGDIFYANDGEERREVHFQPFFNYEEAYKFASQFVGLDSVDEVCEKAKAMDMQQGF